MGNLDYNSDGKSLLKELRKDFRYRIKIDEVIVPENYHSHVPVAAEATSLDYYGDWPGQMERQIEESLVRAAQDEGPPDWVAGPEGNIATVDDVVTIKIM